MARLARVVATGIPHHITQRGNDRGVVLDEDSGRLVYLALLEECRALHELLGICLTSNHVHLIALPRRPDSLALALRDLHGRYAVYLNARRNTTGHLWQGRFYSCPLDDAHLWTALRYVELNPVRARMVASSEEYLWSSAAAHCQGDDARRLLDLDLWRRSWRPADWRAFLASGVSPQEAQRIRAHTHSGRPLGSPEFVHEIERQLNRTLAPQKGGRPRKLLVDPAQQPLDFG